MKQLYSIGIMIGMLLNGSAVAMMDKNQEAVTLDRDAFAEILKHMGEYSSKEYSIPIPVRFTHKTKDNVHNPLLIQDYDPVGMYNSEKECLEVWGRLYSWEGGKAHKETKYEIYGIKKTDFKDFFWKLRSFEGFEDLNNSDPEKVFVANENYEEKPPFFINRNDEKVIIYHDDDKYIRKFGHITFEKDALSIQKGYSPFRITFDTKVVNALKKELTQKESTQKEPEVRMPVLQPVACDKHVSTPAPQPVQETVKPIDDDTQTEESILMRGMVPSFLILALILYGVTK